MKNLLLLPITYYLTPAFLLLSACSSNDDIREDIRIHEKRLINLDTKLEFQQGLVERLSDSINLLAKEIKTLKLTLTSLQNTYIDLEKKLLTLEGRSEQSKIEKFESNLSDLHKELTGLKASQDDGQKYVKEISFKYADKADQLLPYLLNEIKQNITDWSYVKKLKVLIASLPPAKLFAGLKGNINDSILRSIIIDIIAETKDNGLSSILQDIAFKVGDDMRPQVGYALVECKNEFGVVLLLDAMASENENDRVYAFAVLKRVSGGDAKNFNPYASPKNNAEAIEAWKKWYEESKGKIFTN